MQEARSRAARGCRMLVYDDIFSWVGWGGRLRLGSGKCRLRMYDLRMGHQRDLTHLRPIIVVVSDVSDSKVSVRSCVSHVATSVIREFKLDPQRMIFIEYYAASTYGDKGQHAIPERYETVEFVWHEDKALRPRWRALNPELRGEVKKLMQDRD